MKRLVLVLGSFFIGNAFAYTPESSDQLENMIRGAIEKNQEAKDSGVAVSVFTRDGLLYAGGFGFRDKDNKLPVTSSTLFGIGSTTKAFTALDLKLLENRGLLKITDKVQTHLPHFELSNETLSKEATIEDLLSHRLGLPRHDLLWYAPPFKRRELLEKLKYLDFPLKAEKNFRKTFQYNNLLYSTAGIIVEEKSGMSWESFTQKNILNPLGMTETFFGLSRIVNREIAVPYEKDLQLKLRDISNVGPAGSIYSNIKDMTKWVQSFMKRSWPGQEDLMHPRIPLIDGPQGSMNYAYALGWMRTAYPEKNVSWLFHGGNIDGFSTMVFFSHELNVGAVVLINQNGSNVPDAVVTEIILDAVRRKTSTEKSGFLNSGNFKVKPLNLNIDSILLPEQRMEMDEVKGFSHPGYGEIFYGKKGDQEYIRYYNYIWKLSDFNEGGFNKVGENQRFMGFPFLVKEESIEAPFEPQVPLIKFQ